MDALLDLLTGSYCTSYKCQRRNKIATSESVVGEPYIRSRVANNTTNMKILLIVSKIGSVTAFLFQT